MDFQRRTYRNPYGFHKNGYSKPGFAKLSGIKVGSPRFQSLMENVDNLRRKYLNNNATAKQQPEEVTCIGNELTKKFPEIFGDDYGRMLLFYMLRVVGGAHSRSRSVIKCNNNNLVLTHVVDEDNDPDRGSAGLLPGIVVRRPNSGSTAPEEVIQNPSRLVLDCVLLTKRQSSLKDGVSFVHMSSNTVDVPERPEHCSDSSLSSLDLLKKTFTPSCPPLLTSAVPPTHTGVTNDTVSQQPLPVPSSATIIQAAEIHTFLGTCVPSMMHYLRRFVDFGCVTSTHLRSVSQWRPEQRYKLLKKILRSGLLDAAPLDMDIAILENQFDTYFLED
ncbi:hypothetical protein BDN70DRAFT_894519 [Pholiota conissans]|uniref:Uncharacterized protein n=1 Tax=Pholiota conissans TaxID=109636 RepID=A0A9P5Z388_9AGAR|nr:hypothetical protein BDN70DRAFT_894519 [Pholiota conissans]